MALVAFAAFGMSSCQPNEPETSVVVNPKTMQIAAGAQDKVRASLNPSKEGVTFVYKSSDESIATVNQSGVVTGVTPGKANIIVSAEGAKSDTCAVTVVDPLDIFAWGGMGLFGIGEEPLCDVYEYTSESSGNTYKLRNYVGTWYLWSSDVLFVDGEGFSGAGYMVALEAPVAIIQEGASKGYYLQTDLTFDNMAPKDSMGVAEEGALTDAAEWGKFVTDSTYEGDGSFKGSNINYYNFDDSYFLRNHTKNNRNNLLETTHGSRGTYHKCVAGHHAPVCDSHKTYHKMDFAPRSGKGSQPRRSFRHG
jgi:hypothetical protein